MSAPPVYRFDVGGCVCTGAEERESVDGELMYYADHAATIDARRALLAEARAIIEATHMTGDVTQEQAWHERRRTWLAKYKEASQ